ncbi:MAG: proline--tRNA ligase, partial [Mycoplasmataceae bacterium]|nr:proline--tRNA ligase [Mycoplasmataceae bacterium]
SIGAIIMGHGDNRGIVIPPKVASIQVDLIEIMANKDQRVSEVSNKIKSFLENNNIRVRVDKTNKSVGFKVSQSEIEGVPIRIEIGPRDLENNKVLIVRRDNIEKEYVEIDNVLEKVSFLLEDIHNNLYKQSKERIQKNIVYTNLYEEFKTLIEKNKFVLVPILKDDVKLEEKIKEETFATARCIPWEINPPKSNDICILTGKETSHFVIFAKSY